MSAGARRFWMITVLICGGMVAAPARAGFNFTAQTRSVTAHTHGPAGDPTQTFSASNFSTFDQTASVTDSPGAGFASQHQRSTLSSTLISIIGGFSGQYPVFVNSGQADGSSTANVSFTVPASTDVDFTAQAGFSDPGHILRGFVTLSGPNTSISWYLTHDSSPPPWPAGGHSQHLLLDPGSYILSTTFNSSLAASASANLGTVASFDVEMAVVPEPSCASLLGLALVSSRLRRSR